MGSSCHSSGESTRVSSKWDRARQRAGGREGSSRWALFLLITLCVAMPVDTTTLSRVNLGVFFEGMGKVDAVYDFWPHTFQVEIPTLINFTRPQVRCPNTSSSLCQTISEAGSKLAEMRLKYIAHFQETLNAAVKLMPTSQQTHSRSRSKRSLLPFIGYLSHKLFGTATDKEVRQLAALIELLEKRGQRTNKAFQHFSENLSSFIALSHARHNNLLKGIQLNHNAISSLTTTLTTLSDTLPASVEFTLLVAHEFYLAIRLQDGLQDFLQGLHHLINHKLSPNILSLQDVQSAMSLISTKLNAINPHLSLKHLTPQEIYSTKNFFWTYHENSLYITIKFPILSPQSKLEVYKVYSVPVPLNDSSTHATQLLDLPKYVAFGSDHQYYTFPAEHMFDKGILNAQKHNLPLYPASESTCITAIFFQSKQDIKKLCDFRVRLNAVKSNIIHINKGQYLLSNISDIFLSCPSGVSRVPGCAFCIYSVPCHCDISTDRIYFPPRLNHCVDNITTTSKSHTVNLAVLLHFYQESQFPQLLADTTFHSSPAVPSLNMQVYQHEMSKVITADKSNDLSLEKMATAVKQNKQVFQTLADPILDSLTNFGIEDTFSLTAILTYADTAACALLFLVSAFLLYQLRSVRRAQALILVQLTHKARSYPTFNLIPTTTPAPPSLPEILTCHDNFDSYAVIAVCVLLICFLIYRYVTRSTKQAILGLEITSGENCSVVQLAKVPFCPKFYHCLASQNFSAFEIKGVLFPTFRWNPGNLTIINFLDNSNLSIPTEISVSILQGLKLRRILLSGRNIFAFVVCKHGQHAFHMKICSPTCTTCQVSLSAVETPPQL